MLRELWAFMLVRKKLWMLPIVLIGALMVAVQGSALAPFIYTIV